MKLDNHGQESKRAVAGIPGMTGIAGVAAAILLLAVAPVFAGTPIDEKLDADAKGVVVVENLAGSVLITGWDRSEVEIKGTLSEDAKDLIVERDGDTVEILVKMPRRIRGRIEDTDLEIHVPKGSSLEIETVSADVEVTNVGGRHQIEVVSGEVILSGDAEQIDVEVVSGSVEVEGKIPDSMVETVSGHITMSGTEGRASVETVSGTIEIDGGDFDRVSCESVSGRIRFEGQPAKNSEFSFESVSGSIDLRLPSDISAEFEVETFSGSIDSDFGGKVRRPRHGPGATLDTVTGDGDALFRIENFSGSVKIREK